jgi:hypothetical protein
MSTQPETTTPNITTPAAPLSVRSAAAGLLWGAAALGILAWWLLKRNFEQSVLFFWPTAIAAGASLGLFVWYLVTALKARRNPETLRAAETQMRPVFSVAMMAGGAVVALLAILLITQEKMQGFAEFSSLIVMALVAGVAGASMRLSWSGPATRQQILDTMLQMRKQLALTLMILGAALVVGGAWYGLSKGFRELGGRFPEGGGMFLVGLVFFSAGLWTNLTLESPATAYTMRMLLLYVGGLTGFLIAVMTALRVILWWTTYFAGGMTVWQGDEGWRFWVCAYVGLLGLGLLFASLLLGQVDIRSNVVMRRLLYGYNAVLTGLLLLAMLVVVNLLIYVALPSNVAWTKTMGMQSLAPSTKRMLEDLRQPVKVYVLMTRYSTNYLEVRDLLDNCRDVTNKIDIEYLSPDLDADRYRKLASIYPELKSQQERGRKGAEAYGRGLLIVYGGGDDNAKLPHAFVPDKDLGDEDRDPKTGEMRGNLFKGEEVLVQQIQSLADKDTKPTIYFTQGHGELMVEDGNSIIDPNEPRLVKYSGAGQLMEKLRKSNCVVKGLVFEPRPKFARDTALYEWSQKSAKDPHEIPADCDVLVIANPEEPFPKEVLAAIDEYMKRPKGKLIVLTRLGITRDGKVVKDGMEEFCKKYGVEVGNDYVLWSPITRWSPGTPHPMAQASVPANTNNKMAKAFATTNIIMISPRTIQPSKIPSQYQAEAILEVASPPNGKFGWAETDTTRFIDPEKYVTQLGQEKVAERAAKQPLTVGVAVTDREGKARAVILGDFLPITNLGVLGAPSHYDFFRSSVDWLVDRPVSPLGIAPRATGNYQVEIDPPGRVRLIWLPLGLTMLTMMCMGAGVWIVRRK